MKEVVTIIDYDHQGRGLGKINNKVIFIPNTIIDEVVEVKIINEKKSYMEGIVTKYIKTSPLRVANTCPYYDTCGGCDLLHLPYEEQLKYKQKKIINIMERYVKDKFEIKEIVKSDNQFNYRNKVTFQANKDNIGFFNKKSNRITNIDTCLLLDKCLNKYLHELKNDNKKIVLRTNGKDILDNNNDCIIKQINNFKYYVSLESFFQINDNVTIKMYDKIKEYCGKDKVDMILDLYCGTGTIGIYVSKCATKVIGIEINKQAIKDANRNKKLNKVNNIEFIANDVSKVINKLKINPDIIIVDPPRAGLDEKTIKTIIKMNPQKVIYTSCDPMTLARDLNILKYYFKIEELTPFDMFPNTYHVECITLLTNKKEKVS